MANVSDWKGFEKQVAVALGGKRRFRTTENYGKIADDVKFSKAMRRDFPQLKRVAIECKKRKSLNIHALFAEAKNKYGDATSKNIILASKVTKKKTLKRQIIRMKRKLLRLNRKRKKPLSSKQLNARISERTKQIRLRHDITALVTVELGFFKVLWDYWLGRDKESGGSDET
jgi:hypothetical protein